MNVRFNYLTILTFFLFLGSSYVKAQNNLGVAEIEHDKLTRLIVKGIFKESGEIFYTKARPTFAMLGFYLNEKRNIDSISVQSRDPEVAEWLRKINHADFLINWDIFIPEEDAKILVNKKVTFYIPTLILDGYDEPDKPVFSKQDIIAALLKSNLHKTSMYHLKNSILIKPVEVVITASHQKK